MSTTYQKNKKELFFSLFSSALVCPTAENQNIFTKTMSFCDSNNAHCCCCSCALERERIHSISFVLVNSTVRIQLVNKTTENDL